MPSAIYEVKSDRFHIRDKRIYILQGLWPNGGQVEAYLDKDQIEGSISSEIELQFNAMERFRDKDLQDATRVTIEITLPNNLNLYHKLNIYINKNGKKILWYTIKAARLIKKQNEPNIFIEEKNYDKISKALQIRGWVVDSERFSMTLYDQKKMKIDTEILWGKRSDVASMYYEEKIDNKCGFFIQLDKFNGKKLYLVLASENRRNVYPITFGTAVFLKEKFTKYLTKGIKYMRMYGVNALITKISEKAEHYKRRPMSYQKWLPKHIPGEMELKSQKSENFPYMPKFSIVVPLYKTSKSYLDQMINSVKEQTYENWELCLSDGSGEKSPLIDSLKQYMQKDNRIKVILNKSELHISENTNEAIKAATGEYIVFMDHDDVICPNALYECVKVLNKDKNIDIIYSDEDKMTMDGHKFFQPNFKPDFNLDLLYSVNYICHLFVVRGSLQKKVGYLHSKYDGAQDYDFILRCIENTNNIYHVPKILYHWRSHEDSTAENPESKNYAFEAGEKAIQAHYNRVGIQATVSKGEFPGLYKSKYSIEGNPLVSIIIPNKDHTDDLKRCMDSIDQNSIYRNYEYIIVENNSTEKETFNFYNKIEASHSNVHVVYWKRAFNFSDINNFGVKYANGDYCLLLNNDTEIINPDCLTEMLGFCMRDDVGVVGARLYYPDDTIQHAGVVIGFGGIAGHCFVQQPRSSTGYCHRIICAQDYNAVTAACMMVKKTVFDKVGGMSSELQVAFNDIDFCLKVRKEGYLVVYNPYAELYHYESKSRGLEDTPEKVERFNKEIKTFEQKWPEILRDGDPYYNPNLSLETQDFSLKRI